MFRVASRTRTLFLLLLAVVAGGVALFTLSAPLPGQEEPPTGAEALQKAVEAGNALFRDKTFGTASRACANCHENPRKPDMNLATRVRDYPKFDKREGKVINLGQKLSQMHASMLKGEPEPLGSDRLVALEAYLMSIARQAD